MPASERFMKQHYGASGYVKPGQPSEDEAAQEMYDALRAIVSRVALVSPYYEMARAAMTKFEEVSNANTKEATK